MHYTAARCARAQKDALHGSAERRGRGNRDREHLIILIASCQAELVGDQGEVEEGADPVLQSRGQYKSILLRPDKIG